MSKKNLKPLIGFISAVLIFAVGFLMSQMDTKTNDPEINGNALYVDYMDVGQGDCTLIQLPDDKCILIDSGEQEYAQQVITNIENLGYNRLDYVIVTHPHTDHMGAMAEIINYFDIGEIYMPKASNTTKAFENLLGTIADKGLSVHTAKAGKVICQTDDYTVELLGPVRDSYEDLNNYSAVVKLAYGKSSFLFTGDAEKLVEDELLENSENKLDADVLKVGHHGSRYSSSSAFLQAVTPEYAVISCGEENSYGHPHKQALKRLSNAGAEILRTDEQGDIQISTLGDGRYTYSTYFFDRM